MSKTEQNVSVEREVQDLPELLSAENSFVLTDGNVYSIYGSLFRNAANFWVIPAGEDSKTLACAEQVLSRMAKCGLNRKGTLYAVGGGVVGDLGGFCASVYMRGIKWVNIPTTLLAQVDSSIGGKTGVDLNNYKNMVGAFHIPEAVVIRTRFIDSLPPRETICGLGEAFKTALLNQTVMRAWIDFKQKSGTEFFPLVQACARFKESVVAEDFKEGGRRKILNLGHTVGHALEYLDCHRLSHGEYVFAGLWAEAGMAEAAGKMRADSYNFIKEECLKFLSGYAVNLIKNTDVALITDAALSDKKNDKGKISIVITQDFKQTEHLIEPSKFAEDFNKWKSAL